MTALAIYQLFGLQINVPECVARVHDPLPAPAICRFCEGDVALVNNAHFYGGRSYGWPLTYACHSCSARVGCHPGTDIPLGTLADKATMQARKAAHAAFDPLWRGKAPGTRRRAYKALAAAMGRPNAHISWMDATECLRVLQLVQSGAVRI